MAYPPSPLVTIHSRICSASALPRSISVSGSRDGPHQILHKSSRPFLIIGSGRARRVAVRVSDLVDGGASPRQSGPSDASCTPRSRGAAYRPRRSGDLRSTRGPASIFPREGPGAARGPPPVAVRRQGSPGAAGRRHRGRTSGAPGPRGRARRRRSAGALEAKHRVVAPQPQQVAVQGQRLGVRAALALVRVELRPQRTIAGRPGSAAAPASPRSPGWETAGTTPDGPGESRPRARARGRRNKGTV